MMRMLRRRSAWRRISKQKRRRASEGAEERVVLCFVVACPCVSALSFCWLRYPRRGVVPHVLS